MWRTNQMSIILVSWSSIRHRIGLIICTLLVCYWATLGLIPPAEYIPVLQPIQPGRHDRIFIAANLHNNEAIFSEWSSQLLKLAAHRKSSARSHLPIELIRVKLASKISSYPSLKAIAKTIRNAYLKDLVNVWMLAELRTEL